ncbi:MAG: response regulator [Desulfobulbaceae bacterium]|nr:response regulator [Desulfobulbaceae bacterium]
MKILVIEDNPINLKLMRDFLRNTDYELLSANNAEQGLEMAKEGQPDLILMDIRMPKLDGLAATRMLKHDEGTKHLNIVAVTAYAMKGDRERILAAGCDGYLAKPFLHKEFISLVRSFDPRYSNSDE